MLGHQDLVNFLTMPIKSIFQKEWPTQGQLRDLTLAKRQRSTNLANKKLIKLPDLQNLTLEETVNVAAKYWGKCSVAAQKNLAESPYPEVAKAVLKSKRKQAKTEGV